MVGKVIGAFVCALVLSASAMAEESALTFIGLRKPEGNSTAPPFLLKDLNGNPGGLDDYRGKVILLHFWATWCVPCRQELPVIHALWERLKATGFVVVAIAGDSRKAVEPFVKEHGLRFPVLLDQYGSALRSYRVKALPSSYLVGRTGKVEWVAIGPVDWGSDGVRHAVDALLGER